MSSSQALVSLSFPLLLAASCCSSSVDARFVRHRQPVMSSARHQWGFNSSTTVSDLIISVQLMASCIICWSLCFACFARGRVVGYVINIHRSTFMVEPMPLDECMCVCVCVWYIQWLIMLSTAPPVIRHRNCPSCSLPSCHLIVWEPLNCTVELFKRRKKCYWGYN